MARKRKRRTRRRNPGLRHSGELVAQWASQGGRYWLKLYRSGDGTYSYQTDHGGGWSHTAAKIKKIVRDQLSFMPSKMRRVKVARTRNPRRPGPIYRGPITGAGQNKKLGRADAARDHKRRAISPRTGNPSYDYAYADKWATLTGVDLWNNDAWQRSYLNPGRLSPHATAAQLGQGRTRNAAGYQNLRNIPPHRKGRYPNPARFNEAERRVLYSIADAIEQVGRRAGGIYNLTGNFGFAPGGAAEKRAFAALVRKKLIKRARSEGRFQYRLTTKGIHFLARPFIKRVARHTRRRR